MDNNKKENDKHEKNNHESDMPQTDVFNTTQSESAGKKRPERKLGRVEIKGNKVTSLTSRDARVIAMTALKILLPVAACVIVIATVLSFTNERKNKETEEVVSSSGESGTVELPNEPLAENVYPEINEMMNTFFSALADGDTETIRTLRDDNTDTELITYKMRSEFIEAYDNINCYTKDGIEENTYFVYVTYEVKFKEIDTKAPGLVAFYVYRDENGSLMIDSDLEESIEAVMKLVTIQDDVVDLYNKIDVSYKEVIASDEKLEVFMEALPGVVTAAVKAELAQNEEQESAGDAEEESSTEQEAQTPESEAQQEEIPQNQTVNQRVRATDTVNVRSSDSEIADRIGSVVSGTELTRIEERANGWSKIIYEGKEAFIKSDFLEVISTEAQGDTIRTVTATTNVNVRNAANQNSDIIGTAQADNTYDLLEDLGEWYKINYNGQNGYVKSEFFN